MDTQRSADSYRGEDVKFIVMIKATYGVERVNLDRWLLNTGVPDLARTASRCVLNLVTPGEGSRFDAVIETWATSSKPLAALLLPAWTERTRAVAFQVSEHIEKDQLEMSPGHPTPAVKLIAGWTRRDDLSPIEARRHWDEHVPLANRVHVGCARYVRHWVQGIAHAHADDVPPYQGIAFQYYRTQMDLEQRSYDKPESVALINDDTAEFLSSADVMHVVEHSVKF